MPPLVLWVLLVKEKQLCNGEGYNTEMNGLMVLLHIADVCVKKGSNVWKVMSLLYRKKNKYIAIDGGNMNC